MTLRPTDWNVVVLGRWNRAILTPAGIGKRLFKLSEGTPVEVFVPLDALGPYQVRHEGLVVAAGSDRLVIQTTEPDFALLDRAKELALTAVSELPVTPLSAVGLNIVYRATGSPKELIDITTHETDKRLVDAKWKIVSRSQQRTVEWHEGHINIRIDNEEEGNYRIGMNFDLQTSELDSLKDWLRKPIAEFASASSAILTTYIQLDPNEDGCDGEEE